MAFRKSNSARCLTCGVFLDIDIHGEENILYHHLGFILEWPGKGWLYCDYEEVKEYLTDWAAELHKEQEIKDEERFASTKALP